MRKIAIIAILTLSAGIAQADTTKAAATYEMGTAATHSVAGDAEAPAAPEAKSGDKKDQDWFFYGYSYRPQGGGWGTRFGLGTGYGYSYGNGYGYGGGRGGYGYGGYGHGGGYGYRWGGHRW